MIGRMWKQIVSNLFANTSNRPTCRKHRFPYAAEILEDRVLLAASEWGDDVNGNFRTAGKWFNGIPPVTGDTAIFGPKAAGGDFTVTFTQAEQSKLEVHSNAKPTFNLGIHIYTVEQLIVGTNLGVGVADTAVLKVQGNILTSPGGTIDYGGTLEVDQSRFKPTGTLIVGDVTKGFVFVRSDGKVESSGELIVGNQKHPGNLSLLSVSGGHETTYTGSKDATIAKKGPGKLDVSEGSRFELTNGADLYIGLSDDATASVIVAGKELNTGALHLATLIADHVALWGNGAFLLVGENGSIEVDSLISGYSGLWPTTETEMTEVYVDGPNALLKTKESLQIFKGEMNIVEGGQVITEGDASIGGNVDAKTSGQPTQFGWALVNVSGENTKWTIKQFLRMNSPFPVGPQNLASLLEIEDKATVEFTPVNNIVKSELHVAQGAHIQISTQGKLKGPTGGIVDGEVNVDGAGSSIEINGDLAIGTKNTTGSEGSVILENGGNAKVGGQTTGGKIIKLSSIGAGDGRLIVRGNGSLAEALFGGSILVGAGGLGEGHLEVWDSGEAVTNTVTHNDGGTILGDSVVRADTITSLGWSAHIRPGDTGSVATLSFDTSAWDATAGVTLFSEIAAVGDNDVLAVTGDAWLGGILDVDLLGYTPGLGDQFEVVTVGGFITGEFDSVNLPALPYGSGLSWEVLYGDNDADPDDEVILRVVDAASGGGVAPSADGDEYTIPHNQILNTQFPLPPTQFLAPVMANDADPNNDQLTAHVVDWPIRGALTFVESTGHFTYTPDANFVGTDYFTYEVFDGTNYSNIATVTIDVTNTPPTAVDDEYTMLLNTTLTVPDAGAPNVFGVLHNDVDSDTDGLHAVLLDDVEHGTLFLDPDGSFQYTPNDATFVGTDYFTYAADDFYEQSIGLVTIHVDSGIPLAGDDAYSTPHDTQLVVPLAGVLDLLANDTGIGPFVVALDNYSGSGTLNLDNDGSFTYDPPAGFDGVESFTYTITGPHGTSAPATVTLTVTNDTPVAYGDSIVTDENNPFTGSIVDNDVDADDADLDVVIDISPSHGAVTIDPVANTITYTPDPGYSGSDWFSYHATDSLSSNSNSAVVTITVVAANQEPAFSPATYSFSIDETAAINTVVGTVSATDPQSQALTYSLSNEYGGLFIVDSATGVITLQGPLDYETLASYNITATVTDTDLNTGIATVAISVNDISESSSPPAPTFAVSGYAYYPNVTRLIEWNEPTPPLGESYTYNVHLYHIGTGQQIHDLMGLAGDSYEFQNLATGDYSAYIRTYNSEGLNSAWDAPYYFQIDPVNAPIVTGPAATTPDASPLVTWWSLPLQTGGAHDFQVYDVTLGSLTYDRTALIDNQFNLDSPYTPLISTHQYSVYLRTSNAIGEYGLWSSPYYFNVTLPNVPIVHSPGSGTNTTPAIYWSNEPGAANYDVLVYNTNTGQPVINDTSNGNQYWYNVTTPLAAANYQVFARAINDGGEITAWSQPHYFDVSQAVTAAGSGGAGGFADLTRPELAPTIDQAIFEWEKIVTDQATRALLESATFDIVDLPENVLGMAVWNGILIDVDAAGYGWFVDPTPATTDEFQYDATASQFTAIAGGPAAGRMDLYTVVLHELGHIAGLQHVDETVATNDLLSETLDYGIRRLPNDSHRLRYEEAKDRRRPAPRKPTTPPPGAYSSDNGRQPRSVSQLIDEVNDYRSLSQSDREKADTPKIDRVFAAIKLERDLSPFG